MTEEMSGPGGDPSGLMPGRPKLTGGPTRPKLTYEIGDPCWIYVGELDEDGKAKLSPGTVVAHFTIPTQPTVFYIIQVGDPEWMHLEIRDALLMAEDDRGILGVAVLQAYEKHNGLGTFDDDNSRDDRH